MKTEEKENMVTSHVSDFAMDSVKEFIGGLGDDWYPYIPEEVRTSVEITEADARMFTCHPYYISRSLQKNSMNVSFRVHKVLEGVEEFLKTNMLTINVFSTDGSVIVRVLCVPISDTSVSNWKQILDTKSIDPHVIEEKEFGYSEPSKVDYQSHSDEEILAVFEEATEIVDELIGKYDKMSHSEIVDILL